MNTRDNNPLHAAINARLAKVLSTLPTTPGWYGAWMQLGPESTEPDRLAVYRAVRDSGCLPPEAGFYLVSWQIDAMTSQEAESSLQDLDDRMQDISEAYEREHGPPWPPADLPIEYEDLRRQYQEAWDRLFVRMLQESGEPEMADLHQADPEEFQRQSEVGRQYFHGQDEPPAWLDELAEAVAANMIEAGGPGRIGRRYHQEDGFWEVVVYLQPVELLGGAEDGEIVSPGFSLDLDGLRGVFDQVHDFAWQALGLSYDEGPHVAVEGVYRGHEVFVQVLAYAPDDEEPGMKLDTTRREP